MDKQISNPKVLLGLMFFLGMGIQPLSSAFAKLLGRKKKIAK